MFQSKLTSSPLSCPALWPDFDAGAALWCRTNRNSGRDDTSENKDVDNELMFHVSTMTAVSPNILFISRAPTRLISPLLLPKLFGTHNDVIFAHSCRRSASVSGISRRMANIPLCDSSGVPLTHSWPEAVLLHALPSTPKIYTKFFDDTMTPLCRWTSFSDFRQLTDDDIITVVPDYFQTVSIWSTADLRP